MADDAGALLVRTGLITDQALLAARQSRASAGGTIGEHLVLAGIVADEALTEFYRSRLLVPRVNPNTLARLPAHVIEAIPLDMAIEFRCVPVALDREGNLTVAMSDPSDSHAVDEVGFFTSKYVVRAVATQMQIAWCLAHYYGHITELGRRLLKPSAGGAAAVAPASPGPDAAAPAQPVPRVRGFTGRVEASRHKVLPPVEGTTPADEPRPSDQILTPTAEDLAKVEAATATAAPDEMPVETSEPYAEVVSLLDHDERTPPRGVVQRRQRHVEPDPPELAARAGEVDVQARNERQVDDGPAVVVAFDDEPTPPPPAAPVVISADDTGRAVRGEEMRPISDSDTQVDTVAVAAAAGDDADDDDDDEDDDWDEAAWQAARASVDRAVTEADADADADEPAVIHDVASAEESAPILLVQKRPVKDTLAEDEPAGAAAEDPVVLLERKKPSDPPPAVAAAVPAESIADAVGGAVQAAARRRDKRTRIGIGVPAAPPRPASVAGARPSEVTTPADGIPTPMEDQKSDASTRPHSVPNELEPAEEVDDGWGPPGTTIPPPFLGAMPGTEVSGGTELIPLAEDSDDQPLLVTGPTPGRAPTRSSAPPLDPLSALHALEEASTRLVELLRRLDHAPSRDEVIDALITYLALSHDRVAFLALKSGAISPFLQRPPAAGPAPSLGLEVPSTLQDVVGTRLPYRGTVPDEPTLRFLTDAFGLPPADVLILPIAVRDRVVAVLYGDGRRGHGFDEHFAIAGRAAGLALERVLQARRAWTQP